MTLGHSTNFVYTSNVFTAHFQMVGSFTPDGVGIGKMFQFDSTALKHAESVYNEVQLSAEQSKLVRGLGSLVAPRIGMSEIPCRGLWLQAIRLWQQESSELVSVMDQKTPAERVKAAFRIKEFFRELTSEMLTNKAELGSLDLVIDEAFQFYLDNFARRKKS
jgi:hypothetical protein